MKTYNRVQITIDDLFLSSHELLTGKNARIRIINAGTEAPWNFTINSHYDGVENFTILAVDGTDVRQKVDETHLTIGVANRWDVLVKVRL